MEAAPALYNHSGAILDDIEASEAVEQQDLRRWEGEREGELVRCTHSGVVWGRPHTQHTHTCVYVGEREAEVGVRGTYSNGNAKVKAEEEAIARDQQWR